MGLRLRHGEIVMFNNRRMMRVRTKRLCAVVTTPGLVMNYFWNFF
ncbi:hypothetical protein MSIMFB_01755 [Mycobacterium simulans]|uniref:Uncharacterized protein n=1 Tax=Mycobacterium simulans TaxID=627089 RepID=A0A7Z7IKE7_9MYCO|nr:hypothetical protein MSIMFB_01755 [Mycobacterium simulans]